MPRFPVAFGRRRSTADNPENAVVAEPSFRVLDRAEVASGKSFDGGARLAAKTHHLPQTSVSGISIEDNIFADLKTNRGSGSSNTTKTTSTDNSSRHSNASTTPSSADLGGHEDWRVASRKSHGDPAMPPIPKSSSGAFLRAAGRTFSFGGQKKQLPPVPAAEEPMPESPPQVEAGPVSGRARATTTSTSTTVTPPKLEADINLDLGGDFSKLLLGFDKRASVATVRDDPAGRQASAPRTLTGGRANQPSPIQIDRTTKIEASPYSWSSQHSNDNLLTSSPGIASPVGENQLPSVPRYPSPLSGVRQKSAALQESNLKRSSAVFGRRASTTECGEQEDEESRLLKDSLSAVNKFMAGGNSSNKASAGRYKDTVPPPWRQASSESKLSKVSSRIDEDNLFDSSLAQASNIARRYVSRQPSPPRNKVMTPAQFERYREDRERQDSASSTPKPVQDNDEDDDNYEDDEDDAEKAKQLAKQRRKQEAHMTVYRQQMMKVTGESANLPSSRPSLQISFSTPNLASLGPGPSGPATGGSDGSDEDEEVPLAILAAHGFPNKNRPPTRLSTMMSNPNLRASQQPSYQRPGSVVGDAPASGSNARLPAFARNLPQDPFVGAGLVHNPVRESFALGGGSPVGTAGQPPTSSIPPGGLIGVIASEERSRAMRRGSPHIDGQSPLPPMGTPGFDPISGIPPNMMYPTAPQMPNPMLLSPGDQAQIQMTQQMQQFMQMQMQFMQMMAVQNANGAMRPNGHMAAQSMGSLNAVAPGMGGGVMNDMGGSDAMLRNSFVGNGSMLDLPRGDNHLRTMSMVQPSSASWIQPAPKPGYAPSILAQGAGYAPSIAPSERSNVGLPGRYRPVSQMPPPLPVDQTRRTSTMSGALGGWPDAGKLVKEPVKKSSGASDDDDEEGWEAMKAKRDKKRSLWKTKKPFGSDVGALIS